METGTQTKPPWNMVEFQTTITLTDDITEGLRNVTFSNEWKELPHSRLNGLKAQIEPLEQNHTWELLKKKTNPYELVYTQQNNDCPTSIACVKPLSRSFFKMIEMLQLSDFFGRLPKGNIKLRSAHVAEGPGGFIEAFLDRASMNRMDVSNIYAMTLKPTSNHIPGWRRAYNFLQRHKEIKIHYGEDGTGDIYVDENQASFISLIEKQKVMLFTGDGGFDFSVDYENQEKNVFPLLIASSIIGLQVLQVDGTFILKLFDIFSESTHFLLRLITLCFKDWTLYKPATSRPCNSERYLICRGFKRAYPIVLETLYTLQRMYRANESYPVPGIFSFFSEKERDFICRHMEYFHVSQIETLEKTIQLNKEDETKFKWNEHYLLAEEWCRKFRVPILTNWKAVAHLS